MRIITGSARGAKLFTLAGENTRPTAERTKEAVFSIIQFDIEGRRILDLFAGSGQLALEALSRGAASALLCDNSREAVEIIKKNAKKTRLDDKCRIETGDAFSVLRRLRNDKFDIVFLDPPYAERLIPGVLRELVDKKLVKPTSLIVCEAASDEDFFCGDNELSNMFEIKKQSKYGVAYVAILQPKEEAL